MLPGKLRKHHPSPAMTYSVVQENVFLNIIRKAIMFISLGSAFHIGAETNNVLSQFRLQDGGAYRILFSR